MKPSTRPSFEQQLEAANAQAPSGLKASVVKRLLNAAVKKPTEAQAKQIETLIQAAPNRVAVAFDLLCELELAQLPSPKLSAIRGCLESVIRAVFDAPPPPEDGETEVCRWLEGEAKAAFATKPPRFDKFQALVLWLVGRYRNPRCFLAYLVEFGKVLAALNKRPPATPRRNRSDTGGFAVREIARRVAAVGRGAHPKWSRLGEISALVDGVQQHYREQAEQAETVIRRQRDLESALGEQRRLNQAQTETITALDLEKQTLQKNIASVQRELANELELRAQAISHADARVREASKAAVSELKAKILPRAKDARLYADRATPAVDQVLRLLIEIEQQLQTKEGM